MERGSLLDVILKTYEVRTRMWEGLLGRLRGLDVVGEEDAEFGRILTAIRDAMREIVPGEWADAPHLRVSELTREDLRRVLKSFLATGVPGYAAPFQHQGSGTINALVLAMLFTIPCTKLLNNNKAPLLCFISTVLNSIGVGLLGLFVRPENVNTNSIWNPMLLIGVLLLGMGYVLFLQSSTVWGKQLYPEDARGQFEGIRILFFVLIPMVVAPLIANPIIKKSGEFVDENGLTAYLPTYTLLLVGAALVLLTIIPLIPAKKYHDKRISEKTAEGKK